MSYQEDPDGRQDAENEVRPVELLVEHGSREEVSEHNDEDDTGNDVDQDLESQKVIDLVGQRSQVGVDSPQNVQLKKNVNTGVPRYSRGLRPAHVREHQNCG
jgi:hypothetical protein